MSEPKDQSNTMDDLDKIHAQYIADSVRVGSTEAWMKAKALITAKIKEVDKEVEGYQTVLQKQFKIHEHLLKVIEAKDKMIASLKGGDDEL